MTIHVILIIIGAFIVYLLKPSILFMYSYTIMALLFPLFANHSGAVTEEDLGNVTGVNGAAISYSYIAIFLIELIRVKIKNIPFIKYAILVALYLIICGVIRELSEKTIRQEIVSYLNMSMPLALMLLNNKFIPTKKSLRTFIILFFFIETIVVILNLNGVFLTIASYLEVGRGDWSSVCGTFCRFNALANYYTTIFLYISLLYFGIKGIKTGYYIGITIFVFITIMITGARASLVMFFAVLLMCIFFYSRENRMFTLFMLSTMFGIGYLILTVDELSNTLSNFVGIGRMIDGLQNALKGADDAHGSTTDATFALLSEYGFNNPLFGNLRLGYGDNAYPKVGAELAGLTSDARLAFLYVEYGFWGLMIMAAYLNSIFKTIRNRIEKKHINQLSICFVYYLALTITEMGFFDYEIFVMMSIYFMVYCKKDNNV